jgi:hypothetical protein
LRSIAGINSMVLLQWVVEKVKRKWWVAERLSLARALD